MPNKEILTLQQKSFTLEAEEDNSTGGDKVSLIIKYSINQLDNNNQYTFGEVIIKINNCSKISEKLTELYKNKKHIKIKL